MKQNRLIAKWLINEGKRSQQTHIQVNDAIIDSTSKHCLTQLKDSAIHKMIVVSREFKTICVASSSNIAVKMELQIPLHLNKPLTGKEYNMLIHTDKDSVFTLLYYERV